MARIVQVETRMALVPQVRRTNAIPSGVSRETPLVEIADADGGRGRGYSHANGTGGLAAMPLLARTLAPRPIGREAEDLALVLLQVDALVAGARREAPQFQHRLDLGADARLPVGDRLAAPEGLRTGSRDAWPRRPPSARASPPASRRCRRPPARHRPRSSPSR